MVGYGRCVGLAAFLRVGDVRREIKKPAHAVPHLLEKPCGNLPFESESLEGFAAAETAQIAEAYAEAFHKCNLYCAEVCRKAENCVMKWEEKFKEWGR